mgnify:CR=1 FL=1
MEGSLKDLIPLRLEKSKSKFKTAKHLLEEGNFDGAVPPAYYAIFHAARAALISKGINPITHKGVKSMFALHFVKPGLVEKEYQKILADAKELREDSDYEEDVIIAQEKAEGIVVDAQKFIEKIEQVLDKIEENRE